MMSNGAKTQLHAQPCGHGAPAAVCLGAAAPASMTYARLARALGAGMTVIVKDPECFVEPSLDGYTLESEMAALIRTTVAAGLDCFHLLGYSVGGGLALVFALAHPERITSLTLVEPAWIGNAIGGEAEAKYLANVDRVMELPAPERGPALLAAMEPPCDSGRTTPSLPPPPPWLGDRAARFALLWSALRNTNLDLAALRDLRVPLYLPVGGRSHPRFMSAARELAARCPSAVIDCYPESSHLDPPHVAETDRFVASLRVVWRSTSLVVQEKAKRYC